MVALGSPEKLVDELSLRALVGQAFGAGFQGTLPPEGFVQLLSETGLGGVILSQDNLSSPAQARALTETLAEKKGEVLAPPLIAVSHEGSSRGGLPPPAAPYPGNRALAAAGSTGYAYEVAYSMALELRAIGVNVNLAPVVDLVDAHSNPSIARRSFARDPELVSRLGVAFIRGLQHGGVSATAKHFPGIGSATRDPAGLISVGETREAMLSAGLKPFADSARAGVDLVLVSHASAPSLDPSRLPASLSAELVTRLLKWEIGFKGVATTDLADHHGALSCFEPGDAARLAIQAGNDLLIAGNKLELLHACMEEVHARAKRSRVFYRRLREAALRVLSLKARRLSRFRRPSLKTYGSIHHWRLAERVASDSVAVLKNNGVIPLGVTKRVGVICSAPPAGDGEELLTPYIRKHHPNVTGFHVDPRPSRGQLEEALELARSVEALIIGAMEHSGEEETVKLAASCTQANPSTIVVGMWEPHDPNVVRDLAAYIATFSRASPSLDIAAAIVFGKAKPNGRAF